MSRGGSGPDAEVAESCRITRQYKGSEHRKRANPTIYEEARQLNVQEILSGVAHHVL